MRASAATASNAVAVIARGEEGALRLGAHVGADAVGAEQHPIAEARRPRVADGVVGVAARVVRDAGAGVADARHVGVVDVDAVASSARVVERGRALAARRRSTAAALARVDRVLGDVDVHAHAMAMADFGERPRRSRPRA